MISPLGPDRARDRAQTPPPSSSFQTRKRGREDNLALGPRQSARSAPKERAIELEMSPGLLGCTVFGATFGPLGPPLP